VVEKLLRVGSQKPWLLCPSKQLCASHFSPPVNWPKQTALRRRWYFMSSSSLSLSIATAPSSASSSEKTVSDSATVVELLPGHTVEFGKSRIYLDRVHEMWRLGYFLDSVGALEDLKRSQIQRGSWSFLRRSSPLDFACLCIGLSSKCCSALKFRFTSSRRTPWWHWQSVCGRRLHMEESPRLKFSPRIIASTGRRRLLVGRLCNLARARSLRGLERLWVKLWSLLRARRINKGIGGISGFM
jgi:hypothetical protein